MITEEPKINKTFQQRSKWKRNPKLLGILGNAGYLLQNFFVAAGNLQKSATHPAEGLETKAVVPRASCVS